MNFLQVAATRQIFTQILRSILIFWLQPAWRPYQTGLRVQNVGNSPLDNFCNWINRGRSHFSISKMLSNDICKESLHQSLVRHLCWRRKCWDQHWTLGAGQKILSWGRHMQVQEDLGQIFSVRRCEEGTGTEEGTHTCRNKGKCQGSQVSGSL